MTKQLETLATQQQSQAAVEPLKEKKPEKNKEKEAENNPLADYEKKIKEREKEISKLDQRIEDLTKQQKKDVNFINNF